MYFTVETRIAVALLVAFFLFGCGNASQPTEVTSSELRQILQSKMGDSALTVPQVQDELRAVTGEIQSSVLSALVPEFSKTNALVNTAATAACKPKFKVVMVGVGIEFTPSATCKLSGTVALKLFPLTAVADLDVVGLTHIERIQLDADIQLLRAGKHVTVNFQFLDAHFTIRKLAFLPIENVTANGMAAVNISASAFKIQSRVNAFEGNTGFGVALLSDIDRAAGKRELKSCVLAGGKASDPAAGNVSACFTLGGN